MTRTRKMVSAFGLLMLLISLSFFNVFPQGDPPQQDGVAKCHNYKKGKKQPTCKCWGNANPNLPKNPNCKPPAGEDPRCTNHCRKDLCECKQRCQS